jgi:hypothetical protein
MAGGRLVAQDGDIVKVEAPEELVARGRRDRRGQGVGDGVDAGCRTRPSRASAPPRCGRCRPPPTPSSSWPSSWPAEGSNASWPGSTSDYWRPLVYLLEARGLVVWLVNARDARAPAGPPQDRPAGWGVAGQAQPAGHAATLVCPTRPDPPVAGLHPAAVRPDRRPAGAAAGAGCRVDALIKLGTVATDIMGSPGGPCWRR